MPTASKTPTRDPIPTLTPTKEQAAAQAWTIQKVSELRLEGGGAIAISPDGTRLALSDLNDESTDIVYVIDLETGQTIWTFQKPPAALTGTKSLAFSPDGALLASGGNQETVYVWNTSNGQLVHELLFQDSVVLKVAFSSDSQLLAAGSAGEQGGVTVWNLAEGQVVDFPGSVLATDVAFQPGMPNSLAIATLWHATETATMGSVLLWNLEDMSVESIFPGNIASGITFSADGDQLVAEIDGSLRFRSLQNSKEIEVQEAAIDSRAVQIDWSIQGNIVVLSRKGTITIWDASGNHIGQISNESAVDVAFSPTGQLFMSIFNEPLQIWEVIASN